MVQSRPRLACEFAEVSGFITASELDRAMDAAARKSSATLAEYIATAHFSPTNFREITLEAAVEFFICPPDLDLFASALHQQISNISSSNPRSVPPLEIQRPLLRYVQAGTFHQWRIAWGYEEAWLRDHRWSKSGPLIDAICLQSEMGWRELVGV